MWQTLFRVPTEIFGYPLLGFGILLAIWVSVSLFLVFRSATGKSIGTSLAENLPFLLVGAAVIAFVLPNLEESVSNADGSTERLGLPVRGYGVAMFVAVCSGVGLALRRSAKRGIPADLVYQLAVWLFVAGFVGARLFYVVQKFDSFRSSSWKEFILSVVNIAAGGLVVYGSLIGALLALAFFVRKHRLPALVFADILAPSMLLGLAIGRIGCLLNGCCFGGTTDMAWAVQFPPESPAYQQQWSQGLVQGFLLAPNGARKPQIQAISEYSPARAAGLRKGDLLATVNQIPIAIDHENEEHGWSHEVVSALTAPPGTPISVTTVDGRQIEWISELAPARSLPIHPTQIYSTLDALVLLTFVLAVTPFTRRDGMLLAWTLSLYAISRFLLEMVRADESSWLGSGMTISQVVSLFVGSVAIALWLMIWRQPEGRLVMR